MRRMLAMAFAALTLATPTVAADVAADPGFDWSGLHVGVHGGAGRLGASGGLGGASIGYDWRFDDVVLGVEGEVSAGGLDGRRAGGAYDTEAFGAVRARIGYAFERFVAYGIAGAAFASADYARGGRSDRNLQAGWLAGLGLEAQLFGRISAKVEYLYVDLDRKSFDVDRDVSLDAAGSQVRLGLNYRF